MEFYLYFCIKFTNELSILEIYMLSTSGEEAGLKLTFSKTKDPLEASSLLGKKTYEKHNDGID